MHCNDISNVNKSSGSASVRCLLSRIYWRAEQIGSTFAFASMLVWTLHGVFFLKKEIKQPKSRGVSAFVVIAEMWANVDLPPCLFTGLES